MVSQTSHIVSSAFSIPIDTQGSNDMDIGEIVEFFIGTA
jgi:hypothetical protein